MMTKEIVGFPWKWFLEGDELMPKIWVQ